MKASTEEKGAAALWRTRVEGWAASGESCKEYAARIGVNPRTLSWWKTMLRRTRTATGEAVGVVEVTEQLAAVFGEGSGVIELEVGGAVIRVRGRVDADALGRVLGVVEGRR